MNGGVNCYANSEQNFTSTLGKHAHSKKGAKSIPGSF